MGKQRLREDPGPKLPGPILGIRAHLAICKVSRLLSSTFHSRVPLLKPDSRKEGTRIVKGLLRNLGFAGLGGLGFGS